MAKKNVKKSAKKKPVSLNPNSLVAVANAVSQQAAVDFTFSSGIGQVTASVFRNGVLINMQSISHTGTINFADVQGGDVISLNGVCTNTATVRVSVRTTPSSPTNFNAGLILKNYLVN